MLVPVILSVLALILFVILIVLLVKECSYESEESSEQYARECARRDMKNRLAAKKREKKERHSALFAQNAGNMLDRMGELRGRVRTLSAVSPQDAGRTSRASRRSTNPFDR